MCFTGLDNSSYVPRPCSRIRYTRDKAPRGEEWRGEYLGVPVTNGNPSRRLNWKGQEETLHGIWFRTNIFNHRPRQPLKKSRVENFLTCLSLRSPFHDERTVPLKILSKLEVFSLSKPITKVYRAYFTIVLVEWICNCFSAAWSNTKYESIFRTDFFIFELLFMWRSVSGSHDRQNLPLEPKTEVWLKTLFLVCRMLANFMNQQIKIDR